MCVPCPTAGLGRVRTTVRHLSSQGRAWTGSLSMPKAIFGRPNFPEMPSSSSPRAQQAFIAIENLEGDLFDTPTSLTFGGPDLRTAYIGSLSMTIGHPGSSIPGRHSATGIAQLPKGLRLFHV